MNSWQLESQRETFRLLAIFPSLVHSVIIILSAALPSSSYQIYSHPNKAQSLPSPFWTARYIIPVCLLGSLYIFSNNKYMLALRIIHAKFFRVNQIEDKHNQM